MNKKLDETTPRKYFEASLVNAQEEVKMAQKSFNLFATLRILLFVAMAAIAFFTLKDYQTETWITLVILLGIFLVLMRYQQKARRKRDFHKNLEIVNKDEIERLQLKFVRTENGTQFQDKNHPYTSDLDIFGDFSIFKLINRTRTSSGAEKLAKWLSYPAALEEILRRQETILEFTKNALWRQNWEATALLHQSASQNIGVLKTWIKSSVEPSLASSLIWRFFPIVTFVLAGLAYAGLLPFWLPMLSLAWQLIIIRRFQGYIQNLAQTSTDLGKTLICYGELLEKVETAPFLTQWWKERSEIADTSSLEFKKLGTIFDRLDFRNNPYFSIIIGIPTMWDLQCLKGLEDWKTKNQAFLEPWLNVLADTEAILSLAGFQYANPSYAIPQITWDSNLEINAEELGHPLINATNKITNNFNMTDIGNTILITGSNMSGKSTFLRTLGLNMVLAQTGAVVCARHFQCSPVRVFSSMRTQDSLEESTSSFYAELKRLKQLLQFADESEKSPVFYLLDEILKGTNSADRHKGAEALIKQLHSKKASGLVSTHDLELGQWGIDKTFVANYHFKSDVIDGKLDFDYKLQAGICKSFNATELMRMMGIEIAQ